MVKGSPTDLVTVAKIQTLKVEGYSTRAIEQKLKHTPQKISRATIARVPAEGAYDNLRRGHRQPDLSGRDKRQIQRLVQKRQVNTVRDIQSELVTKVHRKNNLSGNRQK